MDLLHNYSGIQNLRTAAAAEFASGAMTRQPLPQTRLPDDAL